MKNKVSLVLIVLVSGIGIMADAQKLPSTQKESLFAPANVKIDGNASEWEPKAYSHATDFFFTVANDRENLYVIIQDTTNSSVQRIANNSMSFIFNSVDKKAEVKPVKVSYPKIQGQFSNGISYQLRSKPSLSSDEVIAINKQLNDHLKDMPVSGISDIEGTAISVYNELGITAAQRVNEKKVYALEFKIPLKYLKAVINADGQFNYRLQVNGADTSDGTIVMVGHPIGATNISIDADAAIKARALADTYVDGTYQLAKN